MIICSICKRDINEIGQDNMSYDMNPLCEDCARKQNQMMYLCADSETVIDFDTEKLWND